MTKRNLWRLLLALIGMMLVIPLLRRRPSAHTQYTDPMQMIIDPESVAPITPPPDALRGQRDLTLQGAVNFRDLGGYRTIDGQSIGWNRVYRAGQLSQLTEADLAQLTNLDIKIVCDLRSPEEVNEAPDNLPTGVPSMSIPVNASEPRSKQLRRLLRYRRQMNAAMIEAYTHVIVDQNPSVFGQIFRLLADEKNLPLAFHCTAGKDRAGVTAALLLALLGVPDEVIVADYSLSNRYADVFEQYGRKAIKPLLRMGMDERSLQPLFTANPDTMRATLAHIRQQYGSVERYLIDGAGLTPQIIRAIRENLLIPESPTIEGTSKTQSDIS